MAFKLKFSKKTEKIFADLEASEHLAPFITSKLALALAIHTGVQLTEQEKQTDNLGKDINIQQVTGEYDMLFKSLISINEGKHLTDDEYTQNYLKWYLDKGARLLEQEHKYNGDFLVHLLELDKVI